MAGGLLCAALLSAQDFQRTSHGIRTTVDGVDVEVQFFTPSVVRVYKVPAGKAVEKQSLAVVAEPEEVSFKASAKDGDIVLDSKALRVSLDAASGLISYETAKGGKLLAEKETSDMFTPFDDAGTQTYSVRQAFRLDKDEALYGLGQLQNGKMSQRNQRKMLMQSALW